jgi:hypothetical protein
MDELIARALQGVDPNVPGAFWLIFGNLMALVPWRSLLWFNVLFVVIGALLGGWRGRWQDGAMWALVLGPIGWIVTVHATRRRKYPPPLPRRGRRGG